MIILDNHKENILNNNLCKLCKRSSIKSRRGLIYSHRVNTSSLAGAGWGGINELWECFGLEEAAFRCAASADPVRTRQQTCVCLITCGLLGSDVSSLSRPASTWSSAVFALASHPMSNPSSYMRNIPGKGSFSQGALWNSCHSLSYNLAALLH